MKTVRAILSGAVMVLISTLGAAQGFVASDQVDWFTGPRMEPMMVLVLPYANEMYPLPEEAPALPSCYRIGRCSVNDIYRFRDRPNRLTRLAPEAPPASGAGPALGRYMWFLVPVTPEEHIVPEYRTASQVRDEYRDVSRPIDDPD